MQQNNPYQQSRFRPLLIGIFAPLALVLSGCVVPPGSALPDTPAAGVAVVAAPTAEVGPTEAAAPVNDQPEESSTEEELSVEESSASTAEEAASDDALPGETTPAEPLIDPIREGRVIALPLAPPMSERGQEFSAMAWHGDRLVLVPQFPDRYDNHFYAIDRADILARVRGESDEPLPFSTIVLDDGGLSRTITGFEGYEAIAFDGDLVYLTVETRPGNWMLGYLVAGTVSEDGAEITLDPARRAPIPTQAVLTNMTDESLVIDGDRIVTLYEANGINVNPEPIASVFSLGVEKREPIPMTNIEYRITDASALDEERRFWAINYFWPGDEKLLPPTDEALAARYGDGPSHVLAEQVERLVEFQITDDGIRLTETPPLQLNLLPAGVARNWEGLTRLDAEGINGFLLVTDEFPVTILGYVDSGGRLRIELED